MSLLDKFKKSPEAEAKYQARLAAIHANQDKNKAKREADKAEVQAKKTAITQARGQELGYVSISYVGGYDNQSRYNAKLCFYENQIEYSQFGKPIKDLVIRSSEVDSIEITGQQQTNSRLSVTRMATLGVFSLAAPKKTTVKEASVVIGIKDGRQVFFHTKALSEFEVHQKLANAISYYHSRQAAKTAQPQPVQSGSSADELEKLAALKEKGIITQEEFDAKKKQLLGL